MASATGTTATARATRTRTTGAGTTGARSLAAGAIARRIVPWSKLGDTVAKGFRFGMIRFGSFTEVYLPLDAEVTVKVGERVKGAATVIARLK